MPRTEAARVLREARDLMNTNGRHWIKGDMELYIDEYIIESRNFYGDYRVSSKAQIGDTAYCAWGGIKQVADSFELQVEAMEALVQIISGSDSRYVEYKDDMYHEWEYQFADSDSFYNYPTFEYFWDTCLDAREEVLGDIIAEWNDDDKRTWEDVRASLTKAAANLKRKA